MSVRALEASAAEDFAPCAAADPFSLNASNINPLTGLSTDYLNHFNEAIMLLELIPSLPECRADLLAWQPLGYHEHFARSRLKQREMAMASYEIVELPTRQRFDALCMAMRSTVQAAQRAMARPVSARALTVIADYAVSRLKPLIAHTSAVIHGDDVDFDEVVRNLSPQAAIDAIISQ